MQASADPGRSRHSRASGIGADERDLILLGICDSTRTVLLAKFRSVPLVLLTKDGLP